MAVTFLYIFIILTGCRNEKESFIEENHFALGTINSIKIESSRAKEDLIKKSFDIIDTVESLMSRNITGSDVARTNEAAGIKPVKVSSDTFTVIKKGLEISALGNGSFDITIGPVVSLWGIGTDKARIPPLPELKTALNLVNYSDVRLDEKRKSVFLKKKGMSIDLGAIAKGWAADRVYRFLKEHDVKKGIINLGGNVFVIGKKTDSSDWHVGVQNPEDTRGSYLGVLSVSDEAVVTSGKYERFFIQDGRRYHHIFNTFTGYPVENGLLSVTIVGRESITADAYSTLVFSLGLEEGMKLVEETPFVDAVIVTDSHDVYLSEGIKKRFVLTDSNYRMVE